MRYDTIFWDWNGTIIDDLDTCMTCVNTMLKKRNLHVLANHDEYYNVFCFPIINYYRKAGFDFSKEPYEKLAVEYIDMYKELCKKCVVFPDVLELIKKLNKQGVRQVILSASEKTELISWIKKLGIFDYFYDVIAIDNIYAESKEKVALDWLKSHNEINVDKCIMVGDTTHDSAVADAMNVESVFISRGHNSVSELKSAGKPVFSNVQEFENYLNR